MSVEYFIDSINNWNNTSYCFWQESCDLAKYIVPATGCHLLTLN